MYKMQNELNGNLTLYDVEQLNQEKLCVDLTRP